MMTSTLLPSRLLIDENEPANPNGEVIYDLGVAGQCPKHAQLFVMLGDDSLSVTGLGGNDPLSNRYAECRLVARTLARACTCGHERVAVVHFDAGPLDVPPTRLDRRGLKQLHQGLRTPEDAAGSSVLLPGLDRARQLADKASWHFWNRPETHLIVLSDFEILDDAPDDAFRKLAGFPGEVTAVVLGVEPDQRLRVDEVHVVTIAADDPPGKLARALFDRMTERRTGRMLAGGGVHG